MKDTITLAAKVIVANVAAPTIGETIAQIAVRNPDDTISIITTLIVAIVSLWKVIKKPKPKQN